MDLIPGLPEELGLECLTRLPYSSHLVASHVCRPWHQLLKSKEFYYQRKHFGYTHKVACLVQSSFVDRNECEADQKMMNSPSYAITLFDPVSQRWSRLDSIPNYPNGLPLFCQVASCEGKLIVMGGWDSTTYDSIVYVFVYDFTTHTWRRGKDMPSKTSFFAIGAIGDHVYVAGGHDANKNALKSAWAYNVRNDQWAELTQLSQARDECKGIVIGDQFWVVGGYDTESQGIFEASAESYQLTTGKWKRVEGAWKAGQCPRSCVGFGKDGKLMSWHESDSAVRVGSYLVAMGKQTLVTGSAGHSAHQGGFYMVDINETSEKLKVPIEFSGFVQTGCFVEI